MNTNRGPVIALVVVFVLAVAGYLMFGPLKKSVVSNRANTGNENRNVSTDGNADATGNVNGAANANGRTNTNGSVALNENMNVNAFPPELTYEEELYMDASTDWKTYTNADIGFSVRYPKDWTVEEMVQTRNVAPVSPVRYITIFSPGKSHFLTLGVKRSTDEFLITDRTGVGAGDIKSDGNVTVADTSVSASKLVYQGKTKEWYAAKNGPGQSTVGSHIVNASFGVSDAGNYSSIDLAGSPELTTAKVILSTLAFTK